ncbi:Dedicator of cytokinesis C/D N-terminal [Trinorchestia longiramus]|nr:Dedicator of cytokinesis C/D N-terminal [Trinorchestia longiramus]
MAERRFTRGLTKPGTAAQLRENVSQAVKATAIQQAKSRLVEPLDFEEYMDKNKVLLNNDPVREVLLVPHDAVQYSTIPRQQRTLHCLASVVQSGEVHSPLVRQCLHTYTAPHSLVTYKDSSYAGSYLQLPRLPKLEDLKEQVYEVDTDIEQGDMTVLNTGENILKKGYLLKGPDTANEKLFSNFSSKTFKRRFACLRQEVDGTYLLEFHKDERRHDPKGTIVLDFCTAVCKNPGRGACCFELRLSAAGGGGVSVLSAESLADMEDWTDKLTRVLHADKSADLAPDMPRDKVSPSSPSTTSLSSATSMSNGVSQYGTLRSLQHSLSPHLAKLANENSYSRQQGRLQARTSLFNCCPDLRRGDDLSYSPLECWDESGVGAPQEAGVVGVRVRASCESLKFRLQAPVDASLDGPMSQLEPYMTHMALYNIVTGCKISEDFHFDLNSPMARSLLQGGGSASTGSGTARPRLDSGGPRSRGGDGGEVGGASCPVTVPLNLAGVPEEWLAYPKQVKAAYHFFDLESQCVLSCARPSPHVFLVVVIQKVLQGGVAAAVEPYLKHHQDPKALARLQKIIKTCCSRLGQYRMPLGWSARQLFTPDGKLDPNTDFSPIYKFDEKKTSESEMIKLLTELKKADKLSKFTVIPGSLSIKLSLMEVTTPNSLTPSLEPVVPFPNPPTHEPTFEVQEFPSDLLEDAQPSASYVNHLYVYPRHLNYENQKIFGRARNLVCLIELRDSDAEGAAPLRVIYSRPCQGVGAVSTLTTSASTVVLHHNSFPEWGDEIKIALPHNLTSSHHLLFTFCHLAIEGAKAGKKDEPVEVVGYAWTPLLFRCRLNTEDQTLPVAAHLPAKYLSIEPFGLGKGFAGPEVRWVDSQKNVFRFSSRLISSVLTSDQHLHNFFLTTSALLTPPQTPTTSSGSSASNPFANAFTSAINGAHHPAGVLENGFGESVSGAYRKRTDSCSEAASQNSDEKSSNLVAKSTNSSVPSADTLSAISAISAISPAISTPKSSRSSSVSTLVGSGCMKTGPSEAETVRNVKALLGLDTDTFIRFLPSVLDRLLLVMMAGGGEVGCSVVTTLVELLTRLHAANRLDLVHTYIKYEVNIEQRSSRAFLGSSHGPSSLHEALSRALATVLRPPVTDQSVCDAALQQTPLLLPLLLRAMATSLLTSSRIKMDRRERFSSAFNSWVRSLVESLTHHITQQSKLPHARTANTALALFIKRLLSLVDRGFVFSLIRVYLEAFSPGDRVGLQLLKLSFLRIVSTHPHYIQLNLPVFDTAHLSKEARIRITPEEYRLTPWFVSRHYPVGVVMGAVVACLGEVGEVQRAGVALLRDLLTKHSMDDRYTQENQQGRIACLYLPLVGVLLDNINRLTWPSSRAPHQPPAPPAGGRAATPEGSSSRKSEGRGSARNKSNRVTYASSVDGGSSTPVVQTPSRGTSLRLEMSTPTPCTPRTPAPTNPLSSQNSISSHSSYPFSTVSQTPSHRSEASYLSLIAGPGGFGVAPGGGYFTGRPGGVGELFSRGGAAGLLLSPGRSSTSLESEDVPPSVPASETTLEEDSEDKDDRESKTHSRQLSVSFAGEYSGGGTGELCEVKRYDKLRPTPELLLCLLQVLRHVPHQHLVGYWTTLSNEALLDFLTLLHLCLEHFRYTGKRAALRSAQQGTASHSSHHQQQQQRGASGRKSSTLPAKLQPPYTASGMTPGSTDTYPGPSSSCLVNSNSTSSSGGGGGFAWQRSLQEANLATQVGLIVLDTLSTLMTHCTDRLTEPASAPLLNKTAGLHLIMLQLGQSETLLKHIFAALRGYIETFPDSLFQGDASVCGWLCFELLKSCNSKLCSVRQESSAVLYLLMRANYLHCQNAGINRVHLQVIISVSQLLGEAMGLNNARFQESMALINNYAHTDKAMQATATPQLRITWLHAMARLHLQHRCLSEAALCEVHIAAVMAEYLKGEGLYVEGCAAFSIISPNILKDENNTRTDHAGSQTDTVFTMDSLITQLECCALMLDRAERYEQLGNLYRILVPIYEERRNYSALVHCYSHLYQAYTRVVEVNNSQRRLLGTYFRVAFYGVLHFEDEASKEYVYKEPKVTSLAEVSERLFQQYCDKFGKENVKMIMDSNTVYPEELDSRLAYVQVTHVVPYFSDEENLQRQTEYERNNNINQFVFETPFTRPTEDDELRVDSSSLSSGSEVRVKPKPKAHGRLQDQWKRRVIVTTSYCFPYVQKRIPIVDSKVREMSPIEVAIDEMEGRVKELNDVINKKPTDIKKLQLKLQGSISVQVNAGPLAYATTFLQEAPAPSPTPSSVAGMDSVSLASEGTVYPVNQVARLREVYRQFMVTCKVALELNAELISSDQSEYQMALEVTYGELQSALEAVLGVDGGALLYSDGTNNRTSCGSHPGAAYLSVFGVHGASSMEC